MASLRGLYAPLVYEWCRRTVCRPTMPPTWPKTYLPQCPRKSRASAAIGRATASAVAVDDRPQQDSRPLSQTQGTSQGAGRHGCPSRTGGNPGACGRPLHVLLARRSGTDLERRAIELVRAVSKSEPGRRFGEWRSKGEEVADVANRWESASRQCTTPGTGSGGRSVKNSTG